MGDTFDEYPSYTGQWWYQAKRTVHDYYQRNARFPSEELAEVKEALGRMLPKFRAALEREGIRYTTDSAGSAHYEKTHIPRWDGLLELDMEFVIDGSNVDVTSIRDQPCGKVLNCQQKSLPSRFFHQGNTGLVSAKSVVETFQSVLEKVDVGDNVTFKRSGPAVKLDVCRGPELWFNVDLVPVISIPGRGNFVPKQKQCGKKVPYAWRQSFSREERQMYPDDERPYARRCYRILKAFCSRHYALSEIKSYALKNVFFWELLDKTDDEEWTKGTIARRVMDLLLRLGSCLEEGKITPVFGDKSINLLSTHREKALDIMREYVAEVCYDEDAFIRAFSE